MKRQTKPSIERLLIDGAAIDAAMDQAAREAVEQHFLAGRSVSEWRDGKVVIVPPPTVPSAKRRPSKNTGRRS